MAPRAIPTAKPLYMYPMTNSISSLYSTSLFPSPTRFGTGFNAQCLTPDSTLCETLPERSSDILLSKWEAVHTQRLNCICSACLQVAPLSGALIMLALTSPISSLHPTYSSGLAPGVRFALDLTDNNVGMSEREDFYFSGPQDTTTLRPLAETSSPFAFQR